jgi:hypothetical protein
MRGRSAPEGVLFILNEPVKGRIVAPTTYLGVARAGEDASRPGADLTALAFVPLRRLGIFGGEHRRPRSRTGPAQHVGG